MKRLGIDATAVKDLIEALRTNELDEHTLDAAAEFLGYLIEDNATLARVRRVMLDANTTYSVHDIRIDDEGVGGYRFITPMMVERDALLGALGIDLDELSKEASDAE